MGVPLCVPVVAVPLSPYSLGNYAGSGKSQVVKTVEMLSGSQVSVILFTPSKTVYHPWGRNKSSGLSARRSYHRLILPALELRQRYQGLTSLLPLWHCGWGYQAYVCAGSFPPGLRGAASHNKLASHVLLHPYNCDIVEGCISMNAGVMLKRCYKVLLSRTVALRFALSIPNVFTV